MKIRNILMTAAATAALALPAFAAQMSGKIVSVNGDTITVMSNGKQTTFLIPTNVQIETPSRETLAVAQLQTGQTVVLEVAEPKAAQGQTKAQPEATYIRVEGDIEIEE